MVSRNLERANENDGFKMTAFEILIVVSPIDPIHKLQELGIQVRLIREAFLDVLHQFDQ